MSATRDKSQKTTFVYSNLYQLYRRGKEAAHAGNPPRNNPFSADDDLTQPSLDLGSSPGLTRGAVLKSAPPAVRAEAIPASRIQDYNPPELLGNRIAAHAAREKMLQLAAPVQSHAQAPRTSDAALESLRQNILRLNDLHARLRFMLQELEEWVKD